jgi:hypothetical protein
MACRLAICLERPLLIFPAWSYAQTGGGQHAGNWMDDVMPNGSVQNCTIDHPKKPLTITECGCPDLSHAAGCGRRLG